MANETGDGSRDGLDPPGRPGRPGRRRAIAGALAAAAVVGAGLALTLAGRGSPTRIITRSPAGVSVPVAPPGSGPTAVRSGARHTRPPAEIVATEGDAVVVLDSATGTTRRVLAIEPGSGSGGAVKLEGIALTPDRRTVYYAVAGDCGTGSLFRVPFDAQGPAKRVTAGISPAVSPDGEKLAYATAGPPAADGRPRCPNVVVVRDLRTGAERSWAYPDDRDHGTALYQESSIVEMAWAPDSNRLAYTLAYEGDSVSVLDTGRDHDLGETLEVVVPGGGGDSRHPAWQATSGRLAVVNSAFECCYDDNYTGPPKTLLVDPDQRLSTGLLPPGQRPDALDFDSSGDHLLYVEGGALYRQSPRAAPVLVARGITGADW
jgi:WD40-like Beta Propeller Repeat